MKRIDQDLLENRKNIEKLRRQLKKIKSFELEQELKHLTIKQNRLILEKVKILKGI